MSKIIKTEQSSQLAAPCLNPSHRPGLEPGPQKWEFHEMGHRRDRSFLHALVETAEIVE